MKHLLLRCRHAASTVLVGIVLGVAACTHSGAPPSEGERLARTYCASCHVYPEPGLLDRPRWEALLPDMGGRLGIYRTASRDSLLQRTDWRDVDPTTIYPLEPRLSAEAWEAIVAFYLREAPAALPAAPHEVPVTVGLPGFTAREPAITSRMPLTVLAQIEEDPSVSFVGNYAHPSQLIVIGRRGHLLYQYDLEGAPVAARWDDGRLLILLIGPTPLPSEATAGSIQVVEGPDAPVRPLITGLKRPVDMELADLNGDGRTDIVVCEFGNQTGFLSWYEARSDGTYERHVLSAQPGAADAILHDFDGDGRDDLAVLMAQGDEGVDLYYNRGGGRFEARRVLRFPPVYGSNDIELADFNGDGRMDLLYANGDNGDITPILKSYHGIRLFLAQPDGAFRKALFVPLHGAVAAKAADFDHDGDLDIAAIAYFPDYAHAPEKSFVLLENQGDLTFEAYTFEDAYRGRWMVMDVGDFDGDADPDILLGSNIGFAPQGDQTGLFERWQREPLSFLVLENTNPRPAL